MLVVNFDVVGHENTGEGQNIENRNNFLEHPVYAYAMVVKKFQPLPERGRSRGWKVIISMFMYANAMHVLEMQIKLKRVAFL